MTAVMEGTDVDMIHEPSSDAVPVPRKDGVCLEVRGVHKRYGALAAVNDVSMSVRAGEFVCVLGPSGCGKTTLLRLIAGLDVPDQGQVYMNGKDVTRVPISRRGIGMVFQSYALFPNLDALANVAFGLRQKKTKRADARKRALELLDLVGLSDCAGKYPAQLSGGQQQRVALARALATEPSMLLLDEPLSALDARIRAEMRREIRALQQRLGIPAVMVTHDQEEALTMADRVVVMNRGKLAQFATPEEIYRLPATTFVAEFVGQMNFFPDWTVTQDGTQVRDGTRMLRLAPRENPLPPGPVTLGIRPEDVRVWRNTLSGDNFLSAQVRSVEFRGIAYHVGMEIPGDFAGRFGPRRLDALLKPNEAVRLGLRPDDAVSIHLPPEALIAFVNTPATDGMPSNG